MRIQPFGTLLVTAAVVVGAGARSAGAETPPREIVAVSLSPDGRLVAAGINDLTDSGFRSYVEVWDTASGREVSRYNAPGEEGMRAAVFSPDGKLVAVAEYRQPIVLVDPANGKVVRKLDRADDPSQPPLYQGIGFRPDGGQLAGAAEDGVYLFDVASGKEVKPEPNTSRTFFPVYTNDGSKLLMGGQGFEVWSPGMSFPKKYDHDSSYPSFTRDGAYLVVASEGTGTISVLDGATYDRTARTDPNGKTLRGIRGLALDPSGKYAVVATLDGLAWFKVPSLDKLYTWNGPLFEATAVAYARDGKTIASGHRDGVVRIVDVTGNKPKILRELGTPTGAPSSDPRRLASGDGDGAAPAGAGAPAGYIGTPAPAGSKAALEAVADAAARAMHPPYGTADSALGKACSAAVAKAIASGIPDTAEAKIASTNKIPGARLSSPDSITYFVPLRVVDAQICVPAFAAGYTSKIFQIAMRNCSWLGIIKEGPNGAYGDQLKDSDLIRSGVAQGKECLAAVAEARKAGVPDSATVTISCRDAGIDGDLTLPQIEAQVCNPALGASNDIKAKDDAKTAAQYAPYLKVLTGDKAALFQSEHMAAGTTYYYGPGKRLLSTPADFKNARVWYWYSYDHDSIPQTWRVSGYKFSGDKKAGTYSKSGTGADAPASAFP